MAAVVTNKVNNSTNTVAGNLITLSAPSVVKLSISPDAVSSYERVGDDLIIRLKTGKLIQIKQFYTHFSEGQENNLVLEDENGKLWLAKHTEGLADFNFYEIESVDQLVNSDNNLGPVLLGLAALGGGIAAIASSSSSSDNKNDDLPIGGGIPGADTTAPEAPTDLVISEDGTTLTGKGEPNTTVSVKGPDGAEIATGTVDEDGNFSVALDPALTNGEEVEVTLTDTAGNESDPAQVTAPVIEQPDTTAPDAPTVVVGDDGRTLEISGEPNTKATIYDENNNELGTVDLSNDGTATFIVEPSNGQNVTVTLTDAASNESSPTTASLPDTLPPEALLIALENDTGVDADGITSNGTITINNLESGASWEYSTDGGTTWHAGTGTSFQLPAGEYSAGDVQARQTDAAGNVSSIASLGAVTIVNLVAVNDEASIDLGQRVSITKEPISDDNLQVLGLLDSGNATNSIPVSIAAGSTGDLVIEVSQTALVAVADAFNIEIYDADGNRIAVATADNNPLIGDVADLTILGLTDNNTLVVKISDLPPGEYSVVVRKGDSALGTLLDANKDGISLEELGQGGVVLGEENQALVLDAVEQALGPILGGTVRGILELALNTTTAIGAGKLVEILGDALAGLGLTGALDQVLSAVVDALLNNTLTLIQDTSVTVTVTEHSYSEAHTSVSGNVINPDGAIGSEAGEDSVVPGTEVTQVENSLGEIVTVGAEGATIQGLYGTLVLHADGSYSYTPDGIAKSVGQSEVFTYTISDGSSSAEATLTIEIDGEWLTDDTAQAGIVYEYLVEDGVNMPEAVNYFWTGIVLGAPIGTSGSLTSQSISVEENTTQDLVLKVDAGSVLGVGTSVTVHVEVWDGADWSIYETYSDSQLLNLLGGGVGNISIPNVPQGEYRVKVDLGFSALSVLGSIKVGLESTITHLDEFNDTPKLFAAEGSLFENDAPGADGLPLSISVDGTTFESVSSDAALTIVGNYGSLEINADGSYTYTPDDRAGFGASTEVFYYQIGDEVATLTITIHGSLPDGSIPEIAAGLSAFSMDALVGEPDVVAIGEMSQADDEITAAWDHGLTESFSLDEGSYDLDLIFEDTDNTADPAMSDGLSTSVEKNTDSSSVVNVASDPFGYLVKDPLQEDESLQPAVTI